MWMALTLGQVEPIKRNIIYAIGYLYTSGTTWDQVAAASAEVGAVFATILNVTGSIFSRAEWNTWWTPSPRLVTAAILWFLYIVYLILRSSLPGSKHRRARICAVFGIIAFLDVPMVVISARFLPDIHRPSFSFDSPWQTTALILTMVSTVLLGALLIWIKTDLFKSKARLEKELIN
jgi:heme exporter protein C